MTKREKEALEEIYQLTCYVGREFREVGSSHDATWVRLRLQAAFTTLAAAIDKFHEDMV